MPGQCLCEERKKVLVTSVTDGADFYDIVANRILFPYVLKKKKKENGKLVNSLKSESYSLIYNG